MKTEFTGNQTYGTIFTQHCKPRPDDHLRTLIKRFMAWFDFTRIANEKATGVGFLHFYQ